MNYFPKLRYSSTCSDKSDTLNWTDGATFRFGEKVLGVRSNDRAAVQSVLDLLKGRAEAGQELVVDRLVSLLKGAESSRRGVKNYSLLYAGCKLLKKKLEYAPLLEEFLDFSELEALLVEGNVVELKSHLFGLGDRLVALIGPHAYRSEVVTELLDHVMPEASSHTVIDSGGQVVFRPFKLGWENKKSFRTQPLSDIIWLQANGGASTAGALAVECVNWIDNEIDTGLALQYIGAAISKARIHTIDVGNDVRTLATRVGRALEL